MKRAYIYSRIGYLQDQVLDFSYMKRVIYKSGYVDVGPTQNPTIPFRVANISDEQIY